MSSEHNPIKCTPVIIQIPGIQGTGISWETATEKEKEDITNRILSPVIKNNNEAIQAKDLAVSAKDRSEKIAKEVELVVGDYAGYIDEHFSHDFGIWGDDDTKLELPIGGSIQKISDEIESVKKVASNIEAIQKTSEGIGNINDILPYVDTLEQVGDYAKDIAKVGNSVELVKNVGNNIDAVRALGNTLGLQVQASTKESGSLASVLKEVTPTGYKLTFGIPKGEKGEKGAKGDKGETGTLTTVRVQATQLDSGELPTINQTASVLTIGIPKGEKGLKGDKGDQGNPGVYVGKGTPEGYSIFIDPDGSDYRDFYTKTEMDVLMDNIKLYIDDLIAKEGKKRESFTTKGSQFLNSIEDIMFTWEKA